MENPAENNEHEAPGRQSRVLTEAFALQQTEQVLSKVERLQLKLLPKNYDTTRIRASLVELKSKQEEESEAFMQTEFRLLQELQLWRLSLAQRDARISTFQLRRFYEESLESLNPQTLAALACFYRNLMPSFEVRSKFDFAVTQIFTARSHDNSRILRISREELIKRLENLNAAWTGLPPGWTDEESRKRRVDAVGVFNGLRDEINSYKKLEDLLKSEFFKRIRRHKQHLGEVLYAPDVTAASIECNVATGNKFNELVAAENEELQDTLQAKLGNADIWNAALEENPEWSEQILNHFSPEKNNPDASEDAFEVENQAADSNELQAETNKPQVIAQSFQTNASPSSDSINENFESEPFDEKENNEVSFDAASRYEETEESEVSLDGEVSAEESEKKQSQSSPSEQNSTTPKLTGNPGPGGERRAANVPAFSVVLSELGNSKPDVRILGNYLKASPSAEMRALGFEPFLSFDDETPNAENELALRRRALHLIFRAENLWRQKREEDLKVDGLQDEAPALIEEMQAVGNSLRLANRDVTGENKKERANALLYAGNHLLEARLRLDLVRVKRQPAIKTAVQSDEVKAEVKPEVIAEVKKGDVEADVTPQNKPQNEPEVRRRAANRTRLIPEVRKEVKEVVETAAADAPKQKTNQWLVAATVLVLLIGVCFYFFPPIEETALATSKDVLTLPTGQLRGAENLITAKVNSEMLIGVVSEEWRTLPDEKKKENLKLLVGYGEDYNYKTVMLLNSKGKTVGTANNAEVVLQSVR